MSDQPAGSTSNNPNGPGPNPAAMPPAPTRVPPAPTATASAPNRRPPGGKFVLALAAALFVGWLGWLGYTALTKSRAPTVSRAQAAAATVPVRATLSAGDPTRPSAHVRQGPMAATTPLTPVAEKPGFVVEVVEKLHPNGPEVGAKIGVANLPACAGYTGPGEYLLLLVPDPTATIDGLSAYVLVGQQRSPGAELDGVGPPMVYRWTEKTGDDLRGQVKKLFPSK